MAKPTQLLSYNGGDKIDPGGPKRGTTGWLPAEKIAAQHWNWLWNVASQWVDWLNAELAPLVTNSGLQAVVPWTALPLSAGVGGALHYTRDGAGGVTMLGNILITSGPVYVLGTLPAGCRPQLAVNSPGCDMAVYDSGGSFLGYVTLSVDTTGQVSIANLSNKRGGSGANGPVPNGSTCYMIGSLAFPTGA